MLSPPIRGATVAELADAGARRISIGGALARAAIATTLRAGREMLDPGSFDWTSDLAPGGEIESLLRGG